MDYISIKETADKWGISSRRIQILCNEGRIEGAQKNRYLLGYPEDAEKPADERIKSGRYIKGK